MPDLSPAAWNAIAIAGFGLAIAAGIAWWRVARPGAGGATPGDWIALTKPRVISLLLVTAVAPMYATGRGAPTWGQVLAVIVGGYLMAGGANSINMWFAADIIIMPSVAPSSKI